MICLGSERLLGIVRERGRCRRMGRLRIGWAVGVVAPWCLGIGLGMSISADAGQEPTFGASIAPLVQRAPEAPGDLVPAQFAPAGLGLLAHAPQALVREARLDVGTREDFAQLPDEIEPRKDLKRNVAALKIPDIDRSHKGNPFVGLRPSFDTRQRRSGGYAALQATELTYVHDENLPSGVFAPGEGNFAGPASVENFEPWPDGEAPTTAHSDAAVSPQQGGEAVVTMRPAAINERLMQGATPGVPRAAALASTTPAPADSHPVEVLALSSLPKTLAPAVNVTPQSSERPKFAALVDQDPTGHEKKCLAEAIYFEARSEPEEGQAAVAQVVLNRVSSGLYPPTICGVVYQNRSHYHACQFSFACEGRSLRITDAESWRTATRIAEEVSAGRTYLADVGGSTHYHANYVRPAWARRLEKMDVIGHHIFYKLKAGQT
jgi:spore germination cell wall hydrolase CwlJ-like protein